MAIQGAKMMQKGIKNGAQNTHLDTIISMATRVGTGGRGGALRYKKYRYWVYLMEHIFFEVQLCIKISIFKEKHVFDILIILPSVGTDPTSSNIKIWVTGPGAATRILSQSVY